MATGTHKMPMRIVAHQIGVLCDVSTNIAFPTFVSDSNVVIVAVSRYSRAGSLFTNVDGFRRLTNGATVNFGADDSTITFQSNGYNTGFSITCSIEAVANVYVSIYELVP